MSDYMIRATAAGGMIRAFAAYTKDTVETARKAHNLSPVASAALGRLMTAAVMMGRDLKNEDDLITVKIGCDGPIGGATVTADNSGHVKGYVNNPSVMLPANEFGKLDVGGAFGNGVLSVIKDVGLKEPYSGQTILVSGEIAEDLTYYFASSEQVPSTVALGVLMNRDNTVRQAGGFIIQLMPGANDEIVDTLEKKLQGIKSMTAMLDEGMSPEDILKLLLGDMKLVINDSHEVSFYCNCSKDRVSKALISCGKEELEEMLADGEPVQLECHFCNTKYVFSLEEIEELLKQAK